MQFVDVIVPLQLPQLLTYSVPLELQDKICTGQRVEVHLGKNKSYAAIIFSIHNNKPLTYAVKPIVAIIDHLPLINQKQLQLWSWIANYYLTSLGDIMNVALPAYFKLSNDHILKWNEEAEINNNLLSDSGFILAEALLLHKSLTLEEAKKIIPEDTRWAINELLEHGYALIEDELSERYKPKTEKYVNLTVDKNNDKAINGFFEQLTKTPKQQKLLMAYFQLQPQLGFVPVRTLLEYSKCTHTQLNELVKKDIFKIEEHAVDRLPSWGDESSNELILTSAQQATKIAITNGWKEKDQVLLQGVTGSGKTMIYIDIIKDIIASGKQVLFLLPEIGLTTQMIQRLKTHFGAELGIYHSKFSNNERVEIWNKVKNNLYKVVVGPRSAIWLPYQDLGLIIIDEEHDPSYKQQDPAPRFQARDTALMMAHFHQAKVLLGSATPSIESLYNVQQHKYAYVALNERYNNVALPHIQIVHAKQTQASLSEYLTIPLLDKTIETLNSGRQVIYFQNKRGYAPYLFCNTCGWIAQCKNCDVSLTYHKQSDKLHCHYCNSKFVRISNCLNCGSNHITTRNFGTEKIEEDLQRIFPNKHIARMDWDSTKGKNKQEQLLNDFQKGRIDILVGTQMVTKGLDFENVGLVGILSADNLMSYPDFRSQERAFQLMTQVSGRAGRKHGDGWVIIQTFNKEHPIFNWIQNHNFKSYYLQEINARRQFGYPPFTRLIKIVCKHKNQEKVKLAALDLVHELHKIKEIAIQGPSSGVIARIQNLYIEEVWIKISKQNNQFSQIKFQIAHACNVVQKMKGNSNMQFNINVDPY
jgi:primosomal protein N' (replication factor Y)